MRLPGTIRYSNHAKGVEVYRSAVVGGDGWIDQAYRTITLKEPATGELLTWLQNNAVKQEK